MIAALRPIEETSFAIRQDALEDDSLQPVLGIDPGLSGAWAALWPSGAIAAGDLPIAGNEIAAPELARLVRSLRPYAAIVETVGAMPGQGLSSTWRFAQATGSVLGVLGACSIPLHRVAPGVWKRRFGLSKDKDDARALAIRLWPDCTSFTRKRDHGRAEAALMARLAAETVT